MKEIYFSTLARILIGSLTIPVAAWQIHEYCKKRTEKRLKKKKESRVIEDNALTALLHEERHLIFFLIGSRRSGIVAAGFTLISRNAKS